MSDMRELYKFDVISLGGLKRSGKNTFADIVQSLYPEGEVEIINMSDTLKKIIEIMNPLIAIPKDWPYHRHNLSRYLEALSWIPETENDPYEVMKMIPNVRQFLQRMGTEVGRDIISKDVWTDIVKRQVFEAVIYNNKRVVLTGIRFANELDLGADYFTRPLTVWVHRDGLEVQPNEHSSENSLSSKDFDYVVENNGTFEEFKDNIIEFLGSNK